MPALNFQARFAPLVESGAKTQTIRARRKDGRDPKVGDRLYLYAGMRQKSCRKLGDAIVEGVDRIRIEHPHDIQDHGAARITVRSTPCTDMEFGVQPPLTRVQAVTLAMRDGFPPPNALGELAYWFASTHGLPFEGLLIRWRLV